MNEVQYEGGWCVAFEGPSWISKMLQKEPRGHGRHRKFGAPVDQRREESCEHIVAHMACYGYLSKEKKVVTVDPETTLEEAQEQFGRPMRQQKILDEEGYKLPAIDPIFHHSKNCKVSLLF